MPVPLSRTHAFDHAAIGLSGLCVVHCLLLPLAAAFLPLLSAWAEAEWVHLLFVAIALPLTATALRRSHRRHPLPAAVVALATAGLLLLTLGAVGWPLHALETPLTVAGSLALAGAHLWNLRRLHAARGRPVQRL
jgi:cytochrome bd-type quinol oxidase subunit 2